MTKSLYRIDGKDVWVFSKMDVIVKDELPPGNYIVKQHPLSKEYYLTHVDEFVIPETLYGDVEFLAIRILTTFDSRPGTTGVLLAGEKGSGKSLLAKVVATKAAEKKMPTLIINAPLSGDAFNSFIQSIDQPAVVLFDEFEKVYSTGDDNVAVGVDNEPAMAMTANSQGRLGNGTQSQLLTLLDGTFPTKKLFLFTANNQWRISNNLKNRPGRIYYFVEFDGVSEQFVRDYCNDNLKNKKHMQQMVNLRTVLKTFNFDQLQAVVEEVNRYDELPQESLKMLNVKPTEADRQYNIAVTKKGKAVKLESRNTFTGNPVIEGFSFVMRDGDEQIYKEVEADSMVESNLLRGFFRYEVDGMVITLTEKVGGSFRNWTTFLND